MGTRSMIGVVLDGDFKIAQYSQWDGYPSGQGKTVLNFLRKVNIPAFTEKVRALRWFNEDDKAAADAKWREVGADPDSGWVTMDQSEKFYADPRFAALSRDVGADVLQMVADGGVEFLRNDADFALDSLFCEWAYVVDLDKGVFECYEGFQKEAPKKGRWAGQFTQPEHRETVEYYAVEQRAVFALSDLPDDDEFYNVMVDEYDEDDE